MCTRSPTRRPTARPFLHLGATSAFVTDNADLIVMRDGLRLLLGRVIAVLSALEGFAERTAHLPCLAYTHFQPAQLTTVGKRATLWMQDFGLDVEELCHRLETLRLRGCQGTTGTQASFLELFAGDDAKVRELERRVTAKLGFRDQFAVTGQTYPRKADSADPRRPERHRPVGREDGGRPPTAPARGRAARAVRDRADRFQRDGVQAKPDARRADLRARAVRDLAPGERRPHRGRAVAGAHAGRQRQPPAHAPEAFLGTDAILVLATNIAAGLEVREDVIRRNVAEQMPFMATERWLMLGVAAGGDRQALHEVIRRHSLAVADAVSRGAPNDLLERLGADPAFAGVPAADLRAQLDPANYTGRAARQVGEFLEEYLRPLLARARPLAAEAGSAEVRV